MDPLATAIASTSSHSPSSSSSSALSPTTHSDSAPAHPAPPHPRSRLPKQPKGRSAWPEEALQAQAGLGPPDHEDDDGLEIDSDDDDDDDDDYDDQLEERRVLESFQNPTSVVGHELVPQSIPLLNVASSGARPFVDKHSDEVLPFPLSPKPSSSFLASRRRRGASPRRGSKPTSDSVSTSIELDTVRTADVASATFARSCSGGGASRRSSGSKPSSHPTITVGSNRLPRWCTSTMTRIKRMLGLRGSKLGASEGRNATARIHANPERKGKWNHFKKALLVANLTLSLYSVAGLTSLLLVWGNLLDKSEVMMITNRVELILGTAASALCLATAILGWNGVLLNNRRFLALYTLLLFPTLVLILAPGYMSYKRRHFNLEGKLNAEWSRRLDVESRRWIQDSLSCCGYYNPFVEASASPTCYSRSLLPGCKASLLIFQRKSLETIYTCSFSIVPAHLTILIVALLCSDHVTYRFGKGITPIRYLGKRIQEVDQPRYQRSLQPRSRGGSKK
ncbi:hypothetical protein IE53DRAFT_390362 [Violaceomyces palustris]|uniref:Uncharacterized protein n=1 Tax=Violaceomyces palustris TaxID=1673888 RepID=A0ACD0NNY0_9BASI|nr:hypothetical protein IE53DRAFT_390362 [Violaceomyces palustris]